MSPSPDNPYRVSGFIPPEHPYYDQVYVQRPGLEDVILGNLNTLEKPHGGFIWGPRQCGKTSLLHRIRWQVVGEEWRCAIIAVSKLEEQTRREWYPAVAKSIAAQLGVPAWGLPTSIEDIFDFEQALRHCARAVQASRVLIIFDEIDALIGKGEEWARFLQLLRQLDQGDMTDGIEKWAFVVTAYAPPEEIRRRLPLELIEQVSPIFNAIHPVHVEDWSLEGTAQLVQFLSSKHTFETDLASLVHQWTDGHPYLTQRLLYGLYDHPAIAIGALQIEEAVQRILADSNDPCLAQHLGANLLTRVTPQMRDILQRCVAQGRVRWNNTPEQQNLYKMGFVKHRGSGSSKQTIVRNKIIEEFLKDRVPAPTQLAEASCCRRSTSSDVIPEALTIGLTLAVPAATGWWTFRELSATPTWSEYISLILGQVSWLPPISGAVLFAVAIGGISYVLTYVFLWMLLVHSKRGSRTYEPAKQSKGIAPVALVFDQICEDSQPWKLQARIATTDWLSDLKVSMRTSDRVRWSGDGQILLLGEQRHGELECQLSRGAQLHHMLFPWPDRWTVQLWVEWDDYRLPVRLEVIADAAEALPYKLIAPFRFLLEVAKNLIPKGGGSSGSQ